jgi:hypothetical protein
MKILNLEIKMCACCPNKECIKTNEPIYNPICNEVQDFSYSMRCFITKSMIIDSSTILVDCPLLDKI